MATATVPASTPGLLLQLAQAQNLTVAGVLAVIVVGLAIALVWYAKNSVPMKVWEADQKYRQDTVNVISKIAATVELIATLVKGGR